MTPIAQVEWIAGVLRVWAPGKQYGDPYEFSASVRCIDRETVEIMGVVKAPTHDEVRVIINELLRLGIKRAVWTRMENGEAKKHVFEPKVAT